MADRGPRPGRIEQSRRRAAGTRVSPQTAADILGRFSDALSLLKVAQNSLSAKEIPGTGDELVAIRHASQVFEDVYTDLDHPVSSPVRRSSASDGH
jgi:hypothetical protein